MSDKVMEKLGEIQSSISELAANQKNNYRAIQEQKDVLREQGHTLSRLTTTVEIHEKRSLSLERQVEQSERALEARMTSHEKSSQEQIEPVKKHIEQVQGFFKYAKIILGLTVSVLAVLKYFGKI